MKEGNSRFMPHCKQKSARDVKDLGSRIKEAATSVGGLDRLTLSLTGVKRRTMTDYVANKSEPRISTIIEISSVTGVDLYWLVTGQERTVTTACISINTGLMRRLAGLVISAHHETGMNATGEQIAETAAALYNELLSRSNDMADMEEIETILPQLRHVLKRNLSK